MPEKASGPDAPTGNNTNAAQSAPIPPLNATDGSFLIRLIPSPEYNLTGLHRAQTGPAPPRPPSPKKKSRRTTFTNKCPGVQISRTVLLNQPPQPQWPTQPPPLPSFTYPTIQPQQLPQMLFSTMQLPLPGQWQQTAQGPQSTQWQQSAQWPQSLPPQWPLSAQWPQSAQAQSSQWPLPAQWPQSAQWQSGCNYPTTTIVGQPILPPPINVTAIANATNPTDDKDGTECKKHCCPQGQFSGQTAFTIPSYVAPPFVVPHSGLPNEPSQKTPTQSGNPVNTMTVTVSTDGKRENDGRESARRESVDRERGKREGGKHRKRRKRNKRKRSRVKYSESSSSSTSSDDTRRKPKKRADTETKVEEQEVPRPPTKPISMEYVRERQPKPDEVEIPIGKPIQPPESPLPQPQTGTGEAQPAVSPQEVERLTPPVVQEVSHHSALSEMAKAHMAEESKQISPVFCFIVIVVVGLCLAFALLCVFVPQVIDWIFGLRAQEDIAGLGDFNYVRDRFVVLLDLVKTLFVERQRLMGTTSLPLNSASQPLPTNISVDEFVGAIQRG